MAETGDSDDEFDVEDAVRVLLATGTPEEAARNAKVSKLTLKKVQMMARHMRLAITGSKRNLLDAISLSNH